MRSHFILAGAVALLLLCCETGEIRRVGDEPREAISHAATASYRGGAVPSNTYQMAAVDDPGEKRVILYNLTDNSVPAATVWVNGAFVRQIPSIAPRGSAEVSYSELLEAGAGTRDLRALEQPVRKVEIEIADRLYTVQGPANK